MQKARKRELGQPRALRRGGDRDHQHGGQDRSEAESESVDGTRGEDRRAESALTPVSVIAASSASAPRDRGQALPGRQAPSTISNPPQPTRAAAWLRNVADGATLKAIRVGTATASTAATASTQPGTGVGPGTGAVAGATTAAARFKAVSP